ITSVSCENFSSNRRPDWDQLTGGGMPHSAGWHRWGWRAGVSGVVGLVLIVAACSREREEGERGEEESESAGQEQQERTQTQRPLAPIDWKQVDIGLGKYGALQAD